MRWPEIPGGRAVVLCGEALEFLDFFGSFFYQEKNEQSDKRQGESKFCASVDMQEKIFKHALIKQIMETDDTAELKRIDSAVSDILSNKDLLKNLAKPMRKRLDVEELKREQNYQPVDKKKLHQRMDELNVEESIEQLLTVS